MIEETEKQNESKPIGLEPSQEQALDALAPDFDPKQAEAKEKKVCEEKAQVLAAKQQQVQMLGMLVSGVFAVLASRLGDHWALTQGEVHAIAEPASAVLDKYMPGFETGPEFALVAAVGMAVVPRALQRPEVIEGGEHGHKSESRASQ